MLDDRAERQRRNEGQRSDHDDHANQQCNKERRMGGQRANPCRDGFFSRQGTGERASVDDDPAFDEAADIGADRVVPADEAGLGAGLDQAEEAQLGITDEEIAELARTQRLTR